jgi:hypothetical protein
LTAFFLGSVGDDGWGCWADEYHYTGLEWDDEFEGGKNVAELGNVTAAVCTFPWFAFFQLGVVFPEFFYFFSFSIFFYYSSFCTSCFFLSITIFFDLGLSTSVCSFQRNASFTRSSIPRRWYAAVRGRTLFCCTSLVLRLLPVFFSLIFLFFLPSPFPSWASGFASYTSPFPSVFFVRVLV